MPAIGEHLTAKCYFNNAISDSVDESSLKRLDLDEILKLNEQDSIFLNSSLTSPATTTEIPTRGYVDGLHENSGNRRDLSSVFDNQNNEFDNIKTKIVCLDRITVIEILVQIMNSQLKNTLVTQ